MSCIQVHAACSSAGATFINLSPKNIDGKYPGGQLKKMIQVAFKVAKIMAPSIIYIDNVEMV
jgi:ATP-dependent 26S proteasome regulatory subunit